MITVKSAAELDMMRQAGRIVGETLKLMERMVRPGIRTIELDQAAEAYIRSCGATPSFLNYNGFPKSICVSVNQQVVHGIPGKLVLHEGDIVSIDVGACLNGFHGDAARTFAVGKIAPELQRLIDVTRESFFKGIANAIVGNRVQDISAAIQQHAEAHGYGVVRELVGHGVGRHLHEDPEVPNYVDPRNGRGPRLACGMTLAIEPMINMGTREVIFREDGWTVETKDAKPSAHYENTIIITDGEPEITTLGGAE